MQDAAKTAQVSVSQYPSMSLLIAVSVCRLFCGLAVIKALSFILGPAQFGTLTQIIGVSTMFYAFAGGGVTNVVIRYAGETQDDEARRRWLAAALSAGTVTSILLAGMGLFLYKSGARAVFGDAALANVFLGIAAAQALIGVGNILLAYASGTGDLKTFATANILGTAAWALLTVGATLLAGFPGAVWSMILTPACPALVILWLLRRPLRPVWPLMLKMDRDQARQLLQASGLMVLAICALPVAQTIIRADLAFRDSWYEVGLWQATARLSDAYMQVFSIMAVNLLLPRLLERPEANARNAELWRTGGAMLVLFTLGAVVLYGIGGHVIRLAYSAEFLPATAYLVPQLAGDFAKVAAWILVYRFIATGQLWVQTAAEMFQGASVVVFYFMLWPSQKAFAPVLSHFLSCTALLAALGIAAWRCRK
jgi:O-antigen/teichoic acid export membrane protein